MVSNSYLVQRSFTHRAQTREDPDQALRSVHVGPQGMIGLKQGGSQKAKVLVEEQIVMVTSIMVSQSVFEEGTQQVT